MLIVKLFKFAPKILLFWSSPRIIAFSASRNFDIYYSHSDFKVVSNKDFDRNEVVPRWDFVDLK